IMVVMGGRVIPMFTMNGVPGVFCLRLPWIERLAPGSVLLLLAADVLVAPAMIIGPLAAAAAMIHAARLALWRPWRTFRTPLVWILHCAYAWIALALALRALAAWDLVPASLAIHALTVGAIGGLTLGMMTRTSLGHSGRPLQAGRAEVFCYAVIQLAALTRVFLPLAFPQLYLEAIVGSGLLWSAAFGVFTVAYWPILTRPRVDGKPG
ncbi:MAG: NnrS family protein, partial [Pseudomonadota bacterium]